MTRPLAEPKCDDRAPKVLWKSESARAAALLAAKPDAPQERAVGVERLVPLDEPEALLDKRLVAGLVTDVGEQEAVVRTVLAGTDALADELERGIQTIGRRQQRAVVLRVDQLGMRLEEVAKRQRRREVELYLSASLSLRNLFKTHPELIDTKYDRALLPAPDRLDSALKLIRERVGAGEDRPNYGFLLAYIGHQTGDKALVEEGLGFVKGNESLDTYGALLRGIWLGGK